LKSLTEGQVPFPNKIQGNFFDCGLWIGVEVWC
jgi:hypothetical protein